MRVIERGRQRVSEWVGEGVTENPLHREMRNGRGGDARWW